MSGTKKWAEIKRERQANILDPIHAELDPRVWDQAASEKPVLKTQHAHWIKSKIYETLANAGYTDIQDWLTLVFTGSLTTYQYSEDSDADISLFVDTRVFPEWSRAEMIALLVHKLDGTTLPGTPFPLQDFVVGEGIKPSDLYKPGLRSGYNIDNNKWIVPPEKSRVHDVKSEQGGFYAWALQMADKMERLLRYEPDAAVQFWHQIHKKRQRDMKAGKGDYTESNAVYKMLANRGLFPQISGVSGEYIAKTAMAFNPQDIERYIKEHGPYLYHGGGGGIQRGEHNTEEELASFAKYGLQPSQMWRREPGAVYLAPNFESTPKEGGPIFRVDIRHLDPAHIRGDEYFLRPEGEEESPYESYSDPQDAWNSLAKGSSVAYTKPIPPEHIEHIGGGGFSDDQEHKPNPDFHSYAERWKPTRDPDLQYVPCPACGGKDTKIIYRDGSARCEQCGTPDMSQYIAKTSGAPQVMYHATPWYNREAIERNGLEGEVYLSPHPLAAEEYNRSGQNDLWAVDVAGLQPHSTGDEFGEMPEYTVPGVGAERLMLHTPASHPRHNAEYGPMQPHHERILGLAKTAALTWDGVDLTALREQGRAITNAETPESRAYMHDYGCHNIAPLVADATGGYHASGLYLDPEEPIDHHWVVKDGHIIDATYDSILPPGHPEQRRYVEYDDMPEETDPLEHPENFDRWQKEYIAKTAANDWFAPSYMVPDHIKQQLHEWRQGLPWSEGSNLSPYDRFHVTGLYSPTGFSNPEHQAWVQSRSGLTYPVQTIGVESFGAGAKGHPVVLRVHHPQLQEDTERLQDEAEQHGIEVSRHPEGYKPHITLGYSPEPVEGDHPHMTFPVGPLKDLHTYYDESKRAAKTSSAPVKPPNYRHQDKPSEKCGNCKMNNKGHCWGYGNVEIEHNDVCDSWAPETKTAAFDPGQYDLEPYRADEECHECAYGVAQAYPDLVQESGFYVHPKRGPGDHSWNVAPDETIVDTTSSQHPGPEIVPLGHPHYKRYVSYERAFPQAAQIAHERGEHDYYKDSGGIAECPLCKRTAKTASYPTGFQTMFHVSPRKNRESILEHGLKGHEGEHESPWAYTWDQPRGNYLFDNLDDARMYVHGLRQRQHGENRHEYDEERQFEPPEPPPGWKDWPEEKLDEWTQNWYDNAVPSNDDPLGYDIYSVQAHGLPLGQDPESASVAQKRSEDPNLYGDKNPHWDIGRIHDEYERQAEPLMRDGEIGYPDLDELHNEVGSYHGAEPKRYYVPTAIKPSRLALEEHYPLWDVTPESEEALYEDTAPQEVPSPWMQVPFTERPMPGHESKIATRVLYNGFRPDPVHPKGAGSEPTLPFIYDPAEDLVHLGPANSYHHQLIERTPELRAQYGEVGRWTQPPSQSEEGKAHIHGNMEWPSKRVQFQSEVDEDQERAIRQALKAPEPEDGEDPEWGFQSKTAASHLAQKVYAETIAKDGSTYDLQGKPPTTRFGYAPSLHTQTPVHPDQLSPDVIDDFIAAHKDELEEPGKYIGTWLHDGNYVLDVTEGHDDYDTAFERAWNGHQKAMWDGLKNEEIPVRGLDYQQPLAFA